MESYINCTSKTVHKLIILHESKFCFGQFKFYIKRIICSSTQNITCVKIKCLITMINFTSYLKKKELNI
jgi:hypothetical protein